MYMYFCGDYSMVEILVLAYMYIVNIKPTMCKVHCYSVLQICHTYMLAYLDYRQFSNVTILKECSNHFHSYANIIQVLTFQLS